MGEHSGSDNLLPGEDYGSDNIIGLRCCVWYTSR